MAAKKTNKKNTRSKSKFYVVKTFNESREKIEDRIKTYNEKYVKKQIENSREFITELKSDPARKLDKFVDERKEAFKEARVNTSKAFEKRMKNLRSDTEKRVKKLNVESKKMIKGIENDARLIFDDVIDTGRKRIEKIPMVKRIGTKITEGIESIPKRLNLPSKDEIENLATGIKNVNKKVDELNRQVVNV